MYQIGKVLLVDDDPTQLILLNGYFMGLGCDQIFEASSAQKAIEIVRENKDEISLIVSDLMMPDMDGIEMLRALKQDAFKGSIALISSLEQRLIDSAHKLGNLHQLKIIGTCRKPLTKQCLDNVFHGVDFTEKATLKSVSTASELTDVLAGFEAEQFLPYYQPKVDVLSGRIVGVEALARWEHPANGLISPESFLPTIEGNDLTMELTFLMFRRAFADMAKWRDKGIHIKIALNVTATEVANLSFPSQVQGLLDEYEIEADKIVIEMTENEVLEFNATSMEVLTRFRLMGVDIAIDDFGTGYSNLKTLKEFPYTELKIDQAFIRGMSKDSFSQETVRVAATLGRQLNMRLLAEGVETADEWDFVKARGIDEVQGFYIAKPMPADAFASFYSEAGGTIRVRHAATAA
ncbi:MAG: EAL domain-containing response regulator [Hyphomicrobiales bacterium]